MCFSGRKCVFFWKIAQGSKFAVECDWISKFLKTFKKVVVENKSNALSEKNILPELQKFAVECDWK